MAIRDLKEETDILIPRTHSPSHTPPPPKKEVHSWINDIPNGHMLDKIGCQQIQTFTSVQSLVWLVYNAVYMYIYSMKG